MYFLQQIMCQNFPAALETGVGILIQNNKEILENLQNCKTKTSKRKKYPSLPEKRTLTETIPSDDSAIHQSPHLMKMSNSFLDATAHQT